MTPLSTKTDAFLLVEGNDKHVILPLCQAHSVRETFTVRSPKDDQRQSGGIDQLLRLFEEELQASDRRAVGIVLDADTDNSRRWQSVKGRLGRTGLGYVLPDHPSALGTIIERPNEYVPRVGVWIMPDNQSPGDLEQFASLLIPDGDQLRPYANEVLNKIEADGRHLYRHKRSKAFIHTWLAWQENPGMPMGQAITARALSANSPIAHQFVDWLNRLFN